MERELVITAELVLDETLRLSLRDVCDECRADTESVVEMIAEGVADPIGASPEDWYFDSAALRRIQTALRLQRDLGVNWAGAALALDLLEELESLRRGRGI